jgi:hypothetical protein
MDCSGHEACTSFYENPSFGSDIRKRIIIKIYAVETCSGELIFIVKCMDVVNCADGL